MEQSETDAKSARQDRTKWNNAPSGNQGLALSAKARLPNGGRGMGLGRVR